MQKFEILKSTSTRTLCDSLKTTTRELFDEGYTQVDFEYSTAYDAGLDAMVYSVLVVASTEYDFEGGTVGE